MKTKNDELTITKLKKNVSFWKKRLLENIYNMFEYDNLPVSLPAREIEQRLFQNGYCGIFNHPKYGVVTCETSISGVDIYNHPTILTYAQPILGSGDLSIYSPYMKKNPNIKYACVIWNTDIDIDYSMSIINNILNRYSIILAHIDVSLNISIVNHRATSITTAQTQATADTIKRVYDKIFNGEFDVGVTNSIIDLIKNIPLTGENRDTTLELLNAQQMILKNYYAEFGVRYGYDKRERYITTEINADNQPLLINVENMLKCRQTGIQLFNELYGYNVNVKLNKNFNPVIVQNITTGGEIIDNI